MSWNIKRDSGSNCIFIPAEFKWDDVKVDKHRENYLGHSVKAPVGRWQKGKYYPALLSTCCPFFFFAYCTD